MPIGCGFRSFRGSKEIYLFRSEDHGENREEDPHEHGAFHTVRCEFIALSPFSGIKEAGTDQGGSSDADEDVEQAGKVPEEIMPGKTDRSEKQEDKDSGQRSGPFFSHYERQGSAPYFPVSLHISQVFLDLSDQCGDEGEDGIGQAPEDGQIQSPGRILTGELSIPKSFEKAFTKGLIKGDELEDQEHQRDQPGDQSDGKVPDQGLLFEQDGVEPKDSGSKELKEQYEPNTAPPGNPCPDQKPEHIEHKMREHGHASFHPFADQNLFRLVHSIGPQVEIIVDDVAGRCDQDGRKDQEAVTDPRGDEWGASLFRKREGLEDGSDKPVFEHEHRENDDAQVQGA